MVICIAFDFTSLRKTLDQYFIDNNVFVAGIVWLNPNKPRNEYPIEFIPGYTPPPFIKNVRDFVNNYHNPTMGIREYIENLQKAKHFFNNTYIIIILLYILCWLRVLVAGFYLI